MRIEELDLETIVDRVGLGTERSYIEINTKDKEKVQALLKENDIPNNSNDNALVLFAKSEVEFRIINDILNFENMTKIDKEKFFKIRDEVSSKIYDILEDSDQGMIDYAYLEDEVKRLMEEYE